MSLRKFLVGILAGAMLMTSGFVVPAIADDTLSDPVAVITFDSDTDAAYTLEGGATLTDDGKYGKGLSLDGTSQYADVTSGISDVLSKITGDFAISIWCNPTTVGNWSRVYDFGNDTTKYAFLTASNGSIARFAMKTNDVEQQADFASALGTDEWQNVIVSRSGDTTTTYINGAVSKTSTSITYNFSDLGAFACCYLGKSQFSADAYYAGLIDDLKIYDRALTDDEIKALADDAYVDDGSEKISEYNCQLLSTSYTLNGELAFAAAKTATGTLNASTSVKNYTMDSVTLTAQLYTVAEDGTRTALGDAVEKTFASAEEGAIDISVEITDLSSVESIVTGITSSADGKEYNTTELPVTETELVMPTMAPAGETKISDTAYSDGKVGFNLKNADSVDGVTAIVAEYASDGTLAGVELTPASSGENSIEYTKKSDEDTLKIFAWDGMTPIAGSKSVFSASGTESTYGVHDPSIVQFPNDDTYYVYSSHHLIFTSEDLVNWTKYDFTSKTVQDISPITYSFISSNYSNTTVNGTYWAPDVIYKEGDEHPYWMYISVSCGLGGRNSAISLMKSDSPLFWADENADIVDGGIVFATKEADGYITNSIDANIYTDSSDSNKQYFVWGSFWGGIQAASLTDDGFVEGIDYTSDSTILSSCKNFGTSVFTQYFGTAGPEGAWMIEHDGYRYMFTSYGWLGSNYNTRVARSALTTTFGTGTGTQLVDANGVVMGTEYTKGSTTASGITGYKLIGSFRLGDGTTEMTLDSNNEYSYTYSADGAHVYYGPGHNSAINTESGESFYVSHVRMDAVEGAAWLQIRKMLWTSDGWPVVNPIEYSGEKEQALPKSLITGTYDLASVGHTKMEGTTIYTGTNPNRNYDLPVISSKVTLGDDGTMTDKDGGALGTWAFDGDHTVTLTFTADGDTTLDEFYKSGDVMTMYALLSYDKEEQEYAMALTGIDENHITQFAKKSMTEEIKTDVIEITTTATVIGKSTGGNPELGFDGSGNIMYGGDPSAYVEGDTVYLYVGHDTASDESYVIPEWACYSSKNMTDWTYEGVIMSASSITWASNTTSAWASQVTKYGDKYYFYYCTWDKTDSGKQSIGVAVSDSATGPFKDIGAPLVKGSFTTPQSSNWNDIDPTVLISTDSDGVEHRYLAWGNSKFYICELNEDMISVKDLNGDGEITMGRDVLEKKIKSAGSNVFTEAPWLYERDGKYYLFYAANWREEMAYAMADDPLGRWDYKQTIMPPTATSNTNHPAVIDFNGKTYFIYHNGMLTKGSGFRRSVAIQELEFDENGYVYPLTELSIGLDGTANTLVSAAGKYIGHDEFTNSLSDGSYPLSVEIKAKSAEDGYNTAWEIKPAKATYTFDDTEGADTMDNYVSIESVNKPGLYISYADGTVTLTQDADGLQADNMTFRTVKAINGDENAVSFQCAKDQDKFLTVVNNKLSLSYGADKGAASFTIGTVSPVEKNKIDVADVEPDPDPMAGIENSFDSSATTTIMYIQKTDQDVNTDYAGVSLYIGTRSAGADSSSNWAIESGGRTGNALVLNSGKYVSSSRGPRMTLTSSEVPDGYTMTGTIYAKLSSSTAKLYLGDSTSEQGTTDITSYLSTSDWTAITITVENNSDNFTRVITVGDTTVLTDYGDTFPAFWGTSTNSTSAKVYFDDVSIGMAATSGDTSETALTAADASSVG